MVPGFTDEFIDKLKKLDILCNDDDLIEKKIFISKLSDNNQNYDLTNLLTNMLYTIQSMEGQISHQKYRIDVLIEYIEKNLIKDLDNIYEKQRNLNNLNIRF